MEPLGVSNTNQKDDNDDVSTIVGTKNENNNTDTLIQNNTAATEIPTILPNTTLSSASITIETMNLSSSSVLSSSSSSRTSTTSSSLVQSPVLLPNGIEYSIHTIPKSMRQDIALVFSGIPNMIASMDEYYTLPTCQRAICDLTNWGGLAAIEKDLLLERFVAWSSCICQELEKHGYWGDYIDPCSGLPVRTPYCTVVYPEVDALETLLRYKSYNAGGCKLISHPVWKTHVYPASFFVRAPLPLLLQVIQYATDTVVMKPRTTENV